MSILESGLQVCVPHSKPFAGLFIDSLLYTYKPDPLYFNRVANQGIDVARNALIETFLNNPHWPRFMLFIDNDATWPSEAIVRMMEHDLPMVSACMYTRSLPPTPTMGRYLGPTSHGKHIYAFADIARLIIEKAKRHNVGEDYHTNAILLPQEKDDLVERDGVGLHFTMIRRDVLETIDPPWCLTGGPSGAGEDFYLCKKVRDAGFPIYTDISIHTGHIIGEERDFGLVELMAFLKYVDESYIMDDHSRWEVEVNDIQHPTGKV